MLRICGYIIVLVSMDISMWRIQRYGIPQIIIIDHHEIHHPSTVLVPPLYGNAHISNKCQTATDQRMDPPPAFGRCPKFSTVWPIPVMSAAHTLNISKSENPLSCFLRGTSANQVCLSIIMGIHTWHICIQQHVHKYGYLCVYIYRYARWSTF